MAERVGSKIEYESYEEYVERQNSKYHEYDCPNCLKMNLQNMGEALKVRPGIKTVLDLGSRDSAYFDVMAEKGIICKGIDITPKSVKYARSKGRDVILGDSANVSDYFKEKFDLILSNHSFEHFLFHNKVLQECRKLLSDSGILLIRLPDESSGFRNTDTLHTQIFSRKGLIELFESNGFSVISSLNYPTEFFFILEMA